MIDRVNTMLTDLETARENLLSYGDDIWLSIDHRNPGQLDDGVNFIKVYNAKVASLDVLIGEIATMIRQRENIVAAQPVEVLDAERNDRIIRELDTATPHTLDEDFRYKRPYGFVLDGQAFKDVPTWREVYRLICLQLGHRDPDRFAKLPVEQGLIGEKGKVYYTKDSTKLIVPILIVGGVYAEGNSSANTIRDNIKRLLGFFGLPHKSLTLYLRQDRNANLEDIVA